MTVKAVVRCMFFYEFDEMNLLLVLNFLCPEFEDCEIVFFFQSDVSALSCPDLVIASF